MDGVSTRIRTRSWGRDDHKLGRNSLKRPVDVQSDGDLGLGRGPTSETPAGPVPDILGPPAGWSRGRGGPQGGFDRRLRPVVGSVMRRARSVQTQPFGYRFDTDPTHLGPMTFPP